jgi:hypothetical protein
MTGSERLKVTRFLDGVGAAIFGATTSSNENIDRAGDVNSVELVQALELVEPDGECRLADVAADEGLDILVMDSSADCINVSALW